MGRERKNLSKEVDSQELIQKYWQGLGSGGNAEQMPQRITKKVAKKKFLPERSAKC